MAVNIDCPYGETAVVKHCLATHNHGRLSLCVICDLMTVADHTRSMQKIPDCMDHAPFRRELVTAGAQPSVDHQPLVDASSPRARCAKLTRKRSIQSRGEVVHSV